VTDVTDIRGYVRSLVGDTTGSIWANTTIDDCIRAALGRYAAAVEHVQTQVVQLSAGGLYGLSLAGWISPALQEVAFLLWPASSTLAASTGENKIIDYWYYKSYSGSSEVIYVDLQVEGTTLPAANDYVLVRGIVKSLLEGLDSAAVSTVPDTHFYIITLGAAAYAWRAKEGQLWAAAASYPTAYHVGMMAGMAEDTMREFERELEIIRQKRLERPPWGTPERKRQRRIEND
jgi:hypothetical protein